MQRIIQLFKFYRLLKADQELSSLTAVDDILRAIIVFAHATLEDFLRTLAGKLLPYASQPALNDIPLIGQNPTRPAKFFLGALAQFKGQTVDAIIDRSVDAYLKHTNFNNTVDIAAHLKMLGIEPAKVNGSFLELEQLLERRHLIVHQADRLEPSISYGPPLPQDIPQLRAVDATIVLGWIEAVDSFYSDVLVQVARIQLKRQVQGPTIQPTNERDESND